MSTDIYYDLRVVKFRNENFGLFVQAGASNVTTGWGVNEKRVRDWYMAYFGSKSDLIDYAIFISKYFQNELCVWKSMGRSGRLSAQQWIAKVRKAISSSNVVAPDARDEEQQFLSINALCLKGKGAYAGKSISEILSSARLQASTAPGDTMYQFFKVMDYA